MKPCRILLLEDNRDETVLVERELRKIEPKPDLVLAGSIREAQEYLKACL